ncbi:uncharacterized protein BP5553_01118 [Venustampulla echinocandica]|uniref:Uncharacterized protein n=1 Tax=Venustampulla echinocandica TaxID=2656787 RepID=A0A370U041_9HELO|nr:uncharacterized protein BP5553_01118 [Venustampulla echinocandica]RDL41139.1 hypothetical protein BP5553_01118 [Venustampulla echinocandica]
MEIFRRFAPEAPEPREFRQDKPILIMSWYIIVAREDPPAGNRKPTGASRAGDVRHVRAVSLPAVYALLASRPRSGTTMSTRICFSTRHGYSKYPDESSACGSPPPDGVEVPVTKNTHLPCTLQPEIPTVIDQHGLQPRRTLLASIDMLIATAVANAPVLVSLLQDRGFKKTKWKWEVAQTGSNGRVLRRVKVGWEPKSQNEDVKSMDKSKERAPAESHGGLKEEQGEMEMDDLKPLHGRVGKNQVNVNAGVGVPENVQLGGISVATTWEVSEVPR